MVVLASSSCFSEILRPHRLGDVLAMLARMHCVCFLQLPFLTFQKNISVSLFEIIPY
jgi:hypothetical protein